MVTDVIVVPIDVRNSPQLEPVAHDLFRDYSTLHPDVVANSCSWYNLWVTESYVKENMVYTQIARRWRNHDVIRNVFFSRDVQ